MGAMVGVQGKSGRFRVGMMFDQGGPGYRTVRQYRLGLLGRKMVPEILVFASQVLALIGRRQVPGGSLPVRMFMFAMECHIQ
jgi:hypothetical protein